MSKVAEFPYIMIDSGREGVLENNLLPEPIYLTSGEAEYTNSELLSLNCTQTYVRLKEDDCEFQD